MRRVVWTLCLVVALVLSGAGAAASPPESEMVDLGSLSASPYRQSNADAINNRGQIVGDSYADTEWHMFLWEHGEMADLGSPPGGVPEFVWPNAINDAGVVVGTYRTSEITDTAGFVFDDGTWVTLLDDGDHWVNAEDVNNRGEVLGRANTRDSGIRVFVWRNGTRTYLDLDLPVGHYVSPQAINQRGQVLLHYYDHTPGPGLPPIIRSLIWTNGTVTEIGDPSTYNTVAYGMNDLGQVVGSRFLLGAVSGTAFVWQTGVMTDLPGMGGSWAGAQAINNRGLIVGFAQIPGGTAHAVLWDDAQIHDLGTLGGDESYAYGINERGQVVGWSRTEWGSIHGFLWER